MSNDFTLSPTPTVHDHGCPAYDPDVFTGVNNLRITLDLGKKVYKFGEEVPIKLITVSGDDCDRNVSSISILMRAQSQIKDDNGAEVSPKQTIHLINHVLDSRFRAHSTRVYEANLRDFGYALDPGTYSLSFKLGKAESNIVHFTVTN